MMHLHCVFLEMLATDGANPSLLLIQAMNLLQMEYGLLPTKVLKEDKAEYIQALIDTREAEDITIFLDCMAKLHCKHLKNDIDQYEGSMSEKVDRKGGQKAKKVDRKSGQKTRDAIISLISANQHITTTQMAESLGINRSAISKHLKLMQTKGIIRRVGPDKGGHWEA